MKTTKTIDTTQACEDVLREEWRYNDEQKVWPSQNRVIERLLDRRAEMSGAYAEIHEKLHRHPHALREFFRAVTYTAVSWNPIKTVEARITRNRLAEINRQVVEAAEALAALLEERSVLENLSGFHAHSLYHINEVIERASAGNCIFDWHLKEPLQALRSQYDCKYWPSLAACVTTLAQDASEGDVETTNPVTEVATRSNRASKADFFKALYANIDEYAAAGLGFIPSGLRLTDETIASLANCLLDLPAEQVVDGSYVKRLRQRERAVRS
jgi:hypothetical protein